jgi:dTDP-4-amino-4,6-dideoxygalactose transaminase
MFIINPNEFLLPNFGMTPFRTEYISENYILQNDDYAQDYFNNRFCLNHWNFTYNGREAIALALQYYKLEKEDVVTILTTSNNFYISSCVTLEIEMVCKWNRVIVPETKVIFVNHEFGYPYYDMDYLSTLGIPIIEDCCTTFFSQDNNNKIGSYGDFAVYSLPKFFPLQIGGVITSSKIDVSSFISKCNIKESQYITNVMSSQLKQLDTILLKRKNNFDYAVKLFARIGFSERFINTQEIVPYSLLLNNNDVINSLANFKKYLYANGIQNSIFYGEDAFFIPNHQTLSVTDIDYFVSVIDYYLANKNE